MKGTFLLFLVIFFFLSKMHLGTQGRLHSSTQRKVFFCRWQNHRELTGCSSECSIKAWWQALCHGCKHIFILCFNTCCIILRHKYIMTGCQLQLEHLSMIREADIL